MIIHPLINESNIVYFWMDGTWCYQDELCQFAHKSDDYQTLTFGAFPDEDCIEQLVLEMCSSERL